MDFAELRDTTMDPSLRSLLQVTVEQAAIADEVCSMLMGDDVDCGALHPDQREGRSFPGHLILGATGPTGTGWRRYSKTSSGGSPVHGTRQRKQPGHLRYARARWIDGDGTIAGAIEPIEIQEEMERSFLEYSMSVIVSRALPDVRDGLKPVHRRILYAMSTRGCGRTARTPSAPRSWARSWVATTPTATRPSTTPWPGWPRTSACATR